MPVLHTPAPPAACSQATIRQQKVRMGLEGKEWGGRVMSMRRRQPKLETESYPCPFPPISAASEKIPGAGPRSPIGTMEAFPRASEQKFFIFTYQPP